MIIESILNLGISFFGKVLDLLDTLPQIPSNILTAIDDFLDLIFDNLTVLNFFFPVAYVAGFAVAMIAVINFEKIYSFIMWIVRKIPILNIK